MQIQYHSCYFPHIIVEKSNAQRNFKLIRQTMILSKICLLQNLCWVASVCPFLCHPMNYSPPGSSVHGTLQARILVWLPSPPPGDLPYPGIENASLVSPALQADSLPTEPPGKPRCRIYVLQKLWFSNMIKIYRGIYKIKQTGRKYFNFL